MPLTLQQQYELIKAADNYARVAAVVVADKQRAKRLGEPAYKADERRKTAREKFIARVQELCA